MILTKTKPAGVDVLIQRMQNFLYEQLQSVWGISANDYTAYGRVYRNQTDDGYSPEAYMGSKEYKDTFFDDSVKVNSFFGTGEMQRYNGGLQSQVFIVFMVNLETLKPAVQWRADEEVHRDVEMLLHAPRFGFMLNSVETGIDNVFKEYSGWKKSDGIKFRDTHPWHCFRINLNLLSTITNC